MITVVADDITGAAEIAGVCLRLGVPVSLSLDVKSGQKGVMVIATDTRSMKVEDAVGETKSLAKKLLKKGVSHIFKKTDSVLRGHIPEELKVLAKKFHREKIVLAPANPYTNRSIREGIYYVKDIPLDKTDFNDDPEYPAFSSSVKMLLKGKGLSVFTGHLKKREGLSPGLNVPDTDSMEDLEKVVDWIDEDVFPAGSAAFFEAYLQEKFPDLCGSLFSQPSDRMTGKGLLVAGSNHFQTHDFIKNAMAHGAKVNEMPKMLKIEEIHQGRLTDWKNDLRFLIANYGKIILTVGKIQVRFDNCANVLKERMARTVVQAIQEEGLQELMISGGATVFSIIQKLDWREFEPVEELSPGVVRLREKSTGSYLTIKPGSYEWPPEVASFFDMQYQRL